MTQHVAAGRRRWRESPAVTLAALTGLNGLNYLDRYIAAAALPLILAGLGLSDAAGGFLQSAFIVAYSLACPVVGWIGDRRSRTHTWHRRDGVRARARRRRVRRHAHRGRLGDGLLKRSPRAHFAVSGWSLLCSLPFTLPAVLAPHPSVFWPAMFVTLLLLFINIGPLNAAMANVLPADLRARGFAVTTMAIHLFGDAASPCLIGVTPDRIGLTVPVLVTGCLLALAGVILLLGRAALEQDLRRMEGGQG